MRYRPLIALALAALVLAGCGDDDSSETEAGTEPASTDTSAAPTDDLYGDSGGDTTDTTAAPAEGEATVAVAELEGFGEALVGPDGRTLYLFEMDDGTTSACTGGCLDVWPPLVADGDPVAGDGVDAGLLSTADGAVPDQVVYNGHLLYYFASDAAPGDVNGAEVPAWFVVDPAGNAIEA